MTWSSIGVRNEDVQQREARSKGIGTGEGLEGREKGKGTAVAGEGEAKSIGFGVNGRNKYDRERQNFAGRRISLRSFQKMQNYEALRQYWHTLAIRQ